MYKAIFFTLGFAVGSFTTWRMLKTTYEKVAQDEIDSVKEAYNNLKESYIKEMKNAEKQMASEFDNDDNVNKTLNSLKRYDGIIRRENYYSEDCEMEVDEVQKPYVIPPDEFGESDYETETLYYYADKVLVDTNDNIIDDVDDIVGVESLNHFGEYEDDSVFVRNDKYKTDYEILLDLDNFYDKNPDRMED